MSFRLQLKTRVDFELAVRPRDYSSITSSGLCCKAKSAPVCSSSHVGGSGGINDNRCTLSRLPSSSKCKWQLIFSLLETMRSSFFKWRCFSSTKSVFFKPSSRLARVNERRVIELRSDTFTEPTPAMRHAMMKCDVGDDIWGTDPTVKALEQMGQTLFGHEGALFMPSTGMSNLVGVMLGTQGRGEEIIVGDMSHIYLYEQGGSAVIANAHTRVVPTRRDGTLSLDDLKMAIQPDDHHFPRTTFIAIENTHNMCGGKVLSPSYTGQVREWAKDNGLWIHIDGARLCNAAVALNVSPADLCREVDSVSICLSKGLGAPVGSLLLGSEKTIYRARRLRKLLGGSMRQSGVIASCGIVALEENLHRLHHDHDNARTLAEGIMKIPGISALDMPDTNIVKWKLDSPHLTSRFLQMMAEGDPIVRLVGIDNGTAIRACLYHNIWPEDVDAVVKKTGQVMEQLVNPSDHLETPQNSDRQTY